MGLTSVTCTRKNSIAKVRYFVFIETASDYPSEIINPFKAPALIPLDKKNLLVSNRAKLKLINNSRVN
jgi:hypothetical protein